MIYLPHGAKIGKATVIVDIVPKGNPEIRPATKMNPEYQTIHNTGNTGKGADAKAHNKYIHNMARLKPKDTSHVSWHTTIDENYIIQHLPFNEPAWHCGDGAKGTGNSKSIGHEICHHRDQKSYAQAEENAVALVAYIAKHAGIAIKNTRPHKVWSGKNCPQVILARDGSLAKFVARAQAAYDGYSVKEVKPPTTATTKLYRLVSGHYPTLAAAQAAAKKVGQIGAASAQWMSTRGSGSKWYWTTGTYTSKSAAEAARRKVVDAKIAWVVDITEA